MSVYETQLECFLLPISSFLEGCASKPGLEINLSASPEPSLNSRVNLPHQGCQETGNGREDGDKRNNDGDLSNNNSDCPNLNWPGQIQL